MSTRSQIRFVQGDRTAQVYRHSDGYPECVVHDLAELRDTLVQTRALRGPGYIAADFIFFEKLRGMEVYVNDEVIGERGMQPDRPEDLLKHETIRQVDQPLFLLGHGVEDVGGIHGDEEFLYVVELPERNSPTGRRNWSLKVSSSFPRWDDDGTDEAFEVAIWDFEGTLDGALAEYVEEEKAPA